MPNTWPDLPSAYDNKDFESEYRTNWETYQTNLEDIGSKVDNMLVSTENVVLYDDLTLDSGNIYVNGNVTALYYYGNGSHLTGITGASGGVSNPGTTATDTETEATGSGLDVCASPVKGSNHQVVTAGLSL